MKEVKYNSDLNNDIDVLNTKNNAKNDAILGFGISIGIFGLIEIIAFNLGFQYTPEIILPAIITMVSTGGIVSAITGNISNKKYKIKLRKAKQSASDLQQELAKENNKDIFVRIPNLEILECFENNILDRFGKILSKDNLALNIANALLEGKVDYVQDKLGPLLRSFVSVRDTATKAPHENYYHGFLNGIFTNCKDSLGEYHSNYESGDGYADITFNNLGGTKACVIEIKVCKEKESRAKKANEAIEQILEKHYADAIFEDENITSVNAIGIAFSGKNCALASKWLKAKQ